MYYVYEIKMYVVYAAINFRNFMLNNETKLNVNVLYSNCELMIDN